MVTFLLDGKNRLLHPTTKSDMIRRWLKQGRAKVLQGGLRKGEPLLVQVFKSFKTSKTIDCEFRIGIDPGYKHIGYVVYKIYQNTITNLFSGQIETRTSDVTDNMLERRMYRNIRRRFRRKNVLRKFGNAKFRKPVWKNRKASLFRPTHQHLMLAHWNLLKYIFKRIPIEQAKIHIEYSKFDIHKITNPKVYRWTYQKGIQYGFENVKSYVRNRDNYTCQSCKADVSKIQNEVHHIVEKSNGGSNRPDNLILLCTTCHSKIHKSKIVCPKPVSNNKFRDAGVLNSCMKALFNAMEKYLPVQDTYGYITKSVRLNYNIPKDHVEDAKIIAFSDSLGLQDIQNNYIWIDHNIDISFKQYRRHIRSHTMRQEDRKYYIPGRKGFIAWNRKRRSGQNDKKKISLAELKQKMRQSNISFNIHAKPGKQVMRSKNTNVKFKPGDIIKVSNQVGTCKGWSSTMNRVYCENIGFTSVKQCTTILRNSGLARI